eukprot:TRINITY_DN34858_c0_g1_i1.p1 TRINITY_DN34858_c0_g1~~TRINITY_DN34858_c0_g1_i1.p1  ORF type:complete len:330 (-),score=68.16 TRINITY_DN34858_c0_g1_i1:317-1306(-)
MCIRDRMWGCLVFLSLCVPAVSELVGAAVLPHGDFAYDPTLFTRYAPNQNATRASEALFAGSTRVGAWLAGLEPDTVVLTTPHGLELDWDLAIYGNSRLEGEAVVGRDLDESYGTEFPKYTVRSSAAGDSTTASSIGAALRAGGSNSSKILGWNDVLPLPLHWGEALPLGFLQGNGTRPMPQLVVLGLPLSRHNDSAAVAPGFRSMGQRIGRALDKLNRRVVVVVSTDLAHSHWANLSFGYSPAAEPFEQSVGRWAETLDSEPLFNESAKVVDEVYACGWLGLAMLHGLLEASQENWQPQRCAGPLHPTYYGMMAAGFSRVGEVQPCDS